MKKRCAMVLVFALLLTVLAGCNPSDEELLQGKWKIKADLALAYEDLLARSDASVAAHIDIADFEVRLTLRFEEDGTCSLEADDEDLVVGAANMENAIRQGLSAYLLAQTGKTMDNLLAASGMTLDEMMDRYIAEDLADTISKSLEFTGTYKVKGGKLILIREDGSKFFEGKYEVDEDSLELKSGVTSNLISSLLPLKLKRK